MTILEGPIHTWSLSENSWLIRWYRFLYDDVLEITDTTRLSFCKLFWGTVLSPFVALVVGVISIFAAPIIWAVRWIKDLLADRRNESFSRSLSQAKQTAETPPKPTKVRVSVANKIVAAVSGFFDRLSAWSQRHTNGLHLLGILVIWGAMIAFVLSAAGTGTYYAVNHYMGLLTGLKWTGIGIGSGLVLVVVFTALVWLVLKIHFFEHGMDLMEWIFITGLFNHWLKPLGRLFAQVGRFFRGVYLFFVAGHHAVKYRTCPTIKIIPKAGK